MLNIFFTTFFVLHWTHYYFGSFKYMWVFSPFWNSIYILAGIYILWSLVWQRRRKSKLLYIHVFIWIANLSLVSNGANIFPLGKDDFDKNLKKINIATYNVHILNKYKWNVNYASTQSNVDRLLYDQQIKIACIQELPIRHSHFSIPYYYTNSNTQHSRLGIFSHYPILDTMNIPLTGKTGSAILAKIKISDKTTITVINAHLESLKLEQNYFKTFFKDYENYSYIKTFLHPQQVGSIMKIVNLQKNPVVLCADLNTTPISHSYHKIRENLDDTFLESSKQWLGNTFFLSQWPLRIDYIFVSPSVQSHDTRVLDIDFSDHKPVLTTLVVE